MANKEQALRLRAIRALGPYLHREELIELARRPHAGEVRTHNDEGETYSIHASIVNDRFIIEAESWSLHLEISFFLTFSECLEEHQKVSNCCL